jgi:hypothetical protein
LRQVAAGRLDPPSIHVAAAVPQGEEAQGQRSLPQREGKARPQFRASSTRQSDAVSAGDVAANSGQPVPPESRTGSKRAWRAPTGTGRPTVHAKRHLGHASVCRRTKRAQRSWDQPAFNLRRRRDRTACCQTSSRRS